MNFINDFKDQLFQINEETFEESSLALFDFQYNNNATYKLYCDSLKKNPRTVKKFSSIPFLPIEFFKNHKIVSSKNPTQRIFKSSGTTSSNRSEHHVKDLDFYHRVAHRIFKQSFGEISQYSIIALLPSYLEQGDSSLINMVDYFIHHAKPSSGYFLNKEIGLNMNNFENPLLFGVSYALLDLPKIESSRSPIVIETGGMKGRKKEITRGELHLEITKKLKVQEVWSEYGMTELMSQAYGKNGLFSFPSWAKALVREINDPFSFLETGKSGGINIIDLANIESCAFIETKDIGIIQKNNAFEILGRFDNSDVRGCSLLI